MLIEDAEDVSDDEHARLMAKADAEGIKLNFEATEGTGALSALT